jgi:hypothetical protein
MIFDFLFKEEKIYCQNCGDEIIEVGGFVGGEKVYCAKNNFSCLIQTEKSNPKIHFEYETKREIYKHIKDERIIHYGKLEKSVKEKRR